MTATIRIAHPEDLEAIRALFDDPLLDSGAVQSIPGRRYVLVLDDESAGLAAAAMCSIDRGRGHLDALAVAEHHDEDKIEERMIDVVHAICAAFGASVFDVRAAL